MSRDTRGQCLGTAQWCPRGRNPARSRAADDSVTRHASFSMSATVRRAGGAMGQGLNKDGLDRFAAVASPHVGDGRVRGLVALVARGDQVQVEAIGTLAVGGRPVERGSLFRIASTTKPITAAATLALVGEGLLGLDGPGDRLLPHP